MLEPRDRWRQTTRVLLVILVLNLAVAAAKALYGWTSGSLAVSSDALHSLLDGISNVVGLLAVGYARRPPDERHPYGYAKAEVVASVAIGAVIAVGAIEFGLNAALRLVDDTQTVVVTPTGVGILVATLAVNVFVTTYEAAAARRLKSPILAADAAHTGADVLVTAVVLASQGAVAFGWWWADPMASLVVLTVILRAAAHIIGDSLKTLLDHAVLDPEAIRTAVMAVADVRGCHRIRSRGMTDAVQLDLHLMADAATPLGEAHDLSHRVEAVLRSKFPGLQDVTIHIEPEGDAEEAL